MSTVSSNTFSYTSTRRPHVHRHVHTRMDTEETHLPALHTYVDNATDGTRRERKVVRLRSSRKEEKTSASHASKISKNQQNTLDAHICCLPYDHVFHWKKCGSLRNIKRSEEKVLCPCNGTPGSVQRRHRYTSSNAIYQNTLLKFSLDDQRGRRQFSDNV